VITYFISMKRNIFVSYLTYIKISVSFSFVFKIIHCCILFILFGYIIKNINVCKILARKKKLIGLEKRIKSTKFLYLIIIILKRIKERG